MCRDRFDCSDTANRTKAPKCPDMMPRALQGKDDGNPRERICLGGKLPIYIDLLGNVTNHWAILPSEVIQQSTPTSSSIHNVPQEEAIVKNVPLNSWSLLYWNRIAAGPQCMSGESAKTKKPTPSHEKQNPESLYNSRTPNTLTRLNF